MTPGRAYALLILVVAVWAGNFPLAKLGLGELGPITLSATRAALAAPILILLARLSDSPLPKLTRVDYRAFVLLSLTGLVCNTTVWFWGLKYTSPAAAGVLGASSPVAVSIAAAIFLKDRLSRWSVAGIVLTTSAVLLVVCRGSLDTLRTLSFNKGDLIVMASQLAWVCYTLYSRANRSVLPPIVIQAGAYVVSLLILAPLCLFESPWISLRGASWRAWAAIVYTAIPVTLGHLWYYQAVRTVGAGRTAVFMNLMPFAVLGLSWALLGESIRWYHAAGASLVIGGVALVTRK